MFANWRWISIILGAISKIERLVTVGPVLVDWQTDWQIFQVGQGLVENWHQIGQIPSYLHNFFPPLA